MSTSAHVCELMIEIFERHRGDGSLKDLRPVGGKERFRDGIREYEFPDRKLTMLYYNQHLGNGEYTTRAVQIVRFNN